MSSQRIKLVYETPLFVGQGTPPPPNGLTDKIYQDIHTLPPLCLNV